MTDHTFVSSLSYRDPKSAIAWLERAFGFEITMAIDGPEDDPTMCHYELSFGGKGRIMVGGEWTDRTRSPASVGGINTQSLHVVVPSDLQAHCDRARAEGAVIDQEPEDQFYGDRIYRAIDPEGHMWTFSMHVRDVTREEAEQALGGRIQATNWT